MHTRLKDDMPTFTASSYTSNSTNAGAFGWGGTSDRSDDRAGYLDAYRQHAQIGGSLNNLNNMANLVMASSTVIQKEKDDMATNGKGKLRVVRVFLVDPDERVPMDKRVLHRTEEITTDATDQELFFGIPVQRLLQVHNDLRQSIKWKDEGSKGDAEPLKEIRIRDLVMSVTTVAEFASRPH